MTPDFLFSVPHGADLIYDIETYPNAFTIGIEDANTDQYWYFECSPWCNNLINLVRFMDICNQQSCRWVGYNNIGFDYPVMHYIYKTIHTGISHKDIYDKAMSIINAPHNARFANLVYESDWVVDQLDLFKIHHFDNMARSTSLKMLEFNMRMDNIEDLPFDVGTELTQEQVKVLASYMRHDIKATKDFYHESKSKIEFREELTSKYSKNFMNHNDTKIGKDYFIMELEKVDPGCCYARVDGRKQIQQTPRDSINLGDVILPYISFNHPEFQRIHNWFKSTTITETKGSIKDINCIIDGFQYDFGTGGIHGSALPGVYTSDKEFVVESRDVKSYYPNLAIRNKLHPEHLGDTFCTVYEDVYDQRIGYKKGTPENAMLKLALNGVYGDSNNQYSPFYDPQFTMAITINGQLSLCMLVEQLVKIPSLEMLLINTDGLEYRVRREYVAHIDEVCAWWEQLTNLILETDVYDKLCVRDCNNYIGVYDTGDIKRKGAYEYELDWHQNHSNIVTAKAAEAALVHGTDVRSFIENHDNVMDFMLRTKVPRSSKLEWGGEQVQNIVRYYISTDGDILEKIMPAKGPTGAFKRANKLTDDYYNEVIQELTGLHPLVDVIDWSTVPWDERINTKNQSKYEERRSGINTGWTVMLCNNMPTPVHDDYYSDINYDWYIKEAEKLIKPLVD